MAGIEKLTSGDVFIKGQSIKQMSENKLSKFRQENLGFVFQSYNLLGSMTALENVELPLMYRDVPKKERERLSSIALDKVGLEKRKNYNPGSGEGKVPICPPEKEAAILDAFRHFNLI